MEGLTDLQRGLVLDLNPVVTPADGLRAGERWALRRQPARVRRQRALGRHAEPHAERHRQPRLLAGRSRRQPVHVRSAQRAVLSREAPFFLDGTELFDVAEQPDLHAADCGAGGRGQADRKSVGHRHRASLGRGRRGDVGDAASTIRLQHRPPSARPGAHRRRSASSTRIESTASNSNRVVAGDARLLFGRSTTSSCRPAPAGRAADGRATTAPIWELIFNRDGRHFGLRYQTTGSTRTFRPRAASSAAAA